MKQRIIQIACLLLFCQLFATSDRILKEKTPHGIQQTLAVYQQPKDTVDVLVLGSSHVFCGVNTAQLWKKYGIAAFDFASSEQALWVSYHYLLEFCKYQKPKVVVLDFYTAAAYPEDYMYANAFLDDSLYGMRFSPNKLALMAACFGDDPELWNKYFPNFSSYHDRYSMLDDKDWEAALGYDAEEYTVFKGFEPLFEGTSVPTPNPDTEEVAPPSDKNILYLNKIADYTEAHGIELYITVVPYNLNDSVEEGSEQHEDWRYNWLEQVWLPERQAKGSTHICFDNVMRHIGDTGLDYEGGRDLADYSGHLSYRGSKRFSNYLGQELQARYDLPDHRDDPVWSSWDTHARKIRKKAEKKGWE